MRWHILFSCVWLTGVVGAGSWAQEPTSQGDASDTALGSTATLEEVQNGGKPQEPAKQEKKARLLTAAAEPVPALRYRFWPAAQELKGGDAKIHFFRTIVAIASSERVNLLDELDSKWNELREAGKEIPVHEIRDSQEPFRLQFDELETMSLCDRQNLDMQIRDLRGPDVYRITLEEVQFARSIARMLKWRMVEQAAAGDWDSFTRTARIGYRLACLVSTGDTLIHNLVGIAIASVITAEVQRGGNYKDSPNFYWSFASLPRPMFNLRTSLELEMSIGERVFPFLSECRRGPLPEVVVQQHWETMQKTLRDIELDLSSSAGLVGALNVDLVKANLLQRGWKEESFKDYPIMQLVLIDFDHTMQEMGDRAMKFYLLPDSVTESVRARESEAFEKWLQEDKSLAAIVARMLFPALKAADQAVKRSEYIINGAMNREALRMHLAKYGELPKSLEVLDVVPALPNPYNHRPFELVVKPTQKNDLVEVVLRGEVPGPQVVSDWVQPFLVELKNNK